MSVLEKVSKEFDEVYKQFEEARRTNDFHEASDIKAYMLGLTKAMSIIIDVNSMNYTVIDSELVSSRISKLNYLDNVN